MKADQYQLAMSDIELLKFQCFYFLYYELLYERNSVNSVGHAKCLSSVSLNGQDAVTVVGYPLGGDTISVTKGVVSRIEVDI